MLEITMKTNGSITFEEGCNLYLQNYKERNLRDDTIRHYLCACSGVFMKREICYDNHGQRLHEAVGPWFFNKCTLGLPHDETSKEGRT